MQKKNTEYGSTCILIFVGNTADNRKDDSELN